MFNANNIDDRRAIVRRAAVAILTSYGTDPADADELSEAAFLRHNGWSWYLASFAVPYHGDGYVQAEEKLWEPKAHVSDKPAAAIIALCLEVFGCMPEELS